MASYPAVIELRVDGVTQVTRVLDTIDKLDRALVSIKKTPLAIDSKNALDGIRVLKTEVDQFIIKLGKGTAQLASTTSGLNAQATAFKTLAANAKIGGEAFKLYTQAAEQARQKTSLTGGLAEIKALSDLYKVGRTGQTQSFKGIEELIKFGNTVPKTTAALDLYRNELQRVLQLVEYGTDDYHKLAKAIAQVNNEIAIGQGAGAAQGPEKLAKKKSSQNGMGKRLESVALGVGFPLLFGGGIGEVAGSLAGSFVGSGFGGQILGGALGGILDEFVVAAAEMGKALENPISNFNTLAEKSAISTKQQELYIKTLIDTGFISEANTEIQKDFISKIGVDGAAKLKNLTGATDQLTREWNTLTLQLQAAIAGPVGKFFVLLAKVLGHGNETRNAAELEKSLSPEQQAVVQKRRAALEAGMRRGALFGGTPLPEALKEQKSINDYIISNAKNIKLSKNMSIEDTKKELEINTKLRNLYVDSYRIQLEGALAKRTLNKEVNQDLIRLNEIQNDYLATNEELAVKLKELKAIQDAGGLGKGIATREQLATLKNNIQSLENKKISLRVEANKESLRLFEEEITKAAEAATRSVELQIGVAQGQQTVYQSQLSLVQATNNLQLQRLSFEEQLLNTAFDQTSNYNTQLEILSNLKRIADERYKLNVSNAKVERLAAISQVDNGVTLLQLEVEKQKIQYQRLLAVTLEAKAQGLLNNSHLAALDAQAQAVNLAGQSLDFAIKNAAVQKSIANAVYAQKVESAQFAAYMEKAAVASRIKTVQSNMKTSTTTSFPQQQGIRSSSFPQQQGIRSSNTYAEKYAAGGYVTQPTMALIGEGGQPEFVIPRSKANDFATNWMAGRRGASAVPQGGATNSGSPPNINIQTGPVMQQGGRQYVTLADMESAMQSVVSSMMGSNRSFSGRRYQGVS